ncbi:hypothetical protein Lpp221_11062 [Lacticaseibacillus paracasei subsp. paracasei Lpp221]|jgi:hypothetical protein|nr:hypothetical protein Lpp221_11062 [Lacticaseibacillus paracasei subsp. paracasei Lpp221]
MILLNVVRGGAIMPSNSVKPNAILDQIYNELEGEAMKLSYQISLVECQKKSTQSIWLSYN